jgi:hypothetical protein
VKTLAPTPALRDNAIGRRLDIVADGRQAPKEEFGWHEISAALHRACPIRHAWGAAVPTADV